MRDWTVRLSDVETLDALGYLAEGNANVVFALNLNLDGQSRCIIRLQKRSRRRLDPAENMRYFANVVCPLFLPNQVIDQGILPVDSTTLEAINDLVIKVEQEGRRPAKRQASRLTTDQGWALIMPDMRPQTPTQSMIEFKPKWLIQSPSAPPNTIRCRNCALREMRASDQRASGVTDSKNQRGKVFCPLNLLSQDMKVLRSISKAVGSSPEKIELFANGMLNNPTIARLREAQLVNNNVHLENFRLHHDGVTLGMTVRDCTLFMRVDEAMSPPRWECVLADLDMKIGDDENYGKWARTEQRLIDEGWYQGTENDHYSDKTACNLG